MRTSSLLVRACCSLCILICIVLWLLPLGVRLEAFASLSYLVFPSATHFPLKQSQHPPCCYTLPQVTTKEYSSLEKKGCLVGQTAFVVVTEKACEKSQAMELAQWISLQGGHVLLGCKHIDCCHSVAQKFSDQHQSTLLEPLYMDLSSLIAVLTTADTVKQRLGALDWLIIDDGATSCEGMPSSYAETHDGLEFMFAHQVVGPWLLLQELTDALTTGKEEERVGRILRWTSPLAASGHLAWSDPHRLPSPTRKAIDTQGRGAITGRMQLAAHLLLSEYARRESTKIETFSVSSGAFDPQRLGWEDPQCGKDMVEDDSSERSSGGGGGGSGGDVTRLTAASEYLWNVLGWNSPLQPVWSKVWGALFRRKEQVNIYPLVLFWIAYA